MPRGELLNILLVRVRQLHLNVKSRCCCVITNVFLCEAQLSDHLGIMVSSQLDLDFSYSELSDIVQLDGAADNSDLEEDEGAPLEENDFLGMINAEAIKALQEGDGSSDGNSISSSSDSEGADELAHVEEEVRL